MNTVRTLIDSGAERHPDKTFLTATEGNQQLSWSQLQSHAKDISALLDQQGLLPGEKVAILLDNGYWTTLLLLGVIYSGRVVLALNALSGPDSLAYVIEHSDAKLLFVNEEYKKKYTCVLGALDASFQIILTDEKHGPSINFPANNSELAQITKDEIAILMYTSGTTGLPKGVLLTHSNLIAGGKNTMDAHNLSSHDIALCVLPLYHINAQMVTVMGPLVSGGELVMPRKFSTQIFWHDIANHQCTWFSVVPTIISYLIEHGAHGVGDAKMRQIQRSVRFGRSASAALSPAKHQQFEQRFGIPIIETMGLTETAAQILSNPMPSKQIKYGSPGRAVGNEAKVVDDAGSQCVAGDIGELMIRGENVMLGYFKNPEATQKVLDPDGWLHTGDLAYQDEDGFFFITGRLKELIIKGGENIAPREIDDVLYGHPAVLEAAAFGVEDEHYGQEVMACVALCPDKEVSVQELLVLCTERLGNYKSPKMIYIRDELPKGPSGKIQRMKLSQ